MARESEYITRKHRIDARLKNSGWTLVHNRSGLDFSKLNAHAVEEYPTESGPADYALYVEGDLVGIIEAKKIEVATANVLEQAKRYARAVSNSKRSWNGYRVPFLYSTNGEQIHYLDVRDGKSLPRQLAAFHRPEALQDFLNSGSDWLSWLKSDSPDNPVLREYQANAIRNIENGIIDQKRAMLVAMATGTGKTFMAVNLIYRLIKSKMAKRILFLVDRKALAAQAAMAFAAFETPTRTLSGKTTAALPPGKRVGLSRDDFQSANSLLPCYQNLIPTRPHGSIVIGEDSAAGVVLLPESDRFEQLENLRWLGKKIADWTVFQNKKATKSDDLYHRQTLLIGHGGQTTLSRSKVAVVGLSGGSSHVVQQLAHLGVGEIIGIDKEKGESTNRHRVVGLSSRDVALKRKKATVMANMVRRINADLKFTEVPFDIPEQVAISQLKRADIVVGCVDNLLARADAHELCQRYLIPYVDIGLLIIPDKSGIGVQSIGGNVFTVIPAGFACSATDTCHRKSLMRKQAGGREAIFKEQISKHKLSASMDYLPVPPSTRFYRS